MVRSSVIVLFRVFLLVIVFSFIFIPTVSACTVNDIKCSSGTLYKCKCTRYMFDTCTYTDWKFYVNCNVGVCRSGSKCAQCTSSGYPTKCSGGVRTYCLHGVKKSVKCTYGCGSSTKCAYCSVATNKGCSDGKVCDDGFNCILVVNGNCGDAHNSGTYVSAPKTTALCRAGDYSWIDSGASDGNYNWKCVGKNGGTTAYCYANRASECSGSGSGDMGGCVTQSACNSWNGGGVWSRSDSCWCPVGEGTCRAKYCSELGGTCRSSGYCEAVGGRNSYPPAAPANCRSPSAGMCCLNGDSYNDECDTNSDCTSFGSCYACDSLEINNSGYFYNKCQYHTKNGSCGDADDKTYCATERPSGSVLCGSGTADWIDSSGTDGYWDWRCLSNCGGGPDTCSAKRSTSINGVCGEANGDIYSGQPGTDLCSTGTASWTNGDEDGTDGTYNWSCIGKCGGTSVTNCFSINDINPSLDDILLKNISGDLVPPESAEGLETDENYFGKNHICQASFNQNSLTKWEISTTDPQGSDDIGDITLMFISDSGVSSVNTDTPNNGVSVFTVDTKDIPAGTYRVKVKIDDKDPVLNDGEWIDGGRDFKVWDCLLDIGGTFFDSSNLPSGGLCSSNLGYSNLISDKKEFGLAYVSNVGSSSEMAVDSPYFTSNNDNNRKLRWSETTTYVADFQNFPGIEPNETKVNGRCISNITITMNLGDTRIVDPYIDDPSINVEYSSVMEQDPWFSVVDGDVFAGDKVNNYVPITCPLNNTTDTTICSTSVRGIVWSKSLTSSLSTHDQTKSHEKEYINKPIDVGEYTYTSLVNNYFNKFDIGTTFLENQTWSNIKSSTGIILIKNDLTINENINDGQFRVIIAGGTITIDSTVNQINAVLIAGSVKANGISNNQLVINGSVYGYNSVDFRRTYTNSMDNNTNPSVLVQYDPSLPFKMPKEVVKVITQWKLE